MSYKQKYRLVWDGETGAEYKVKIYETGYTGEIQTLHQGAAPVLRMDDGDAIRGTSLELTLESEADGQLSGFYTTDNRRYRVELLRDGVTIWQGFTLPELYSEPCVAPPYDVSVTAADGLGILKNIDFFAQQEGMQPLINVVKWILSQTGMDIPVTIADTLRRDGMDKERTMLSQTEVNVAMFAGVTFYEALEMIMTSINAYITQRGGRWHIVRYTDQEVRRELLDDGLSTYADAKVVTLGRVGDDTYPLGGKLTMGIEPARKKLRLENPYEFVPSMLSNHDFSQGLNGWTVHGDVRRRVWEDSQYYLTLNRAEFKGEYAVVSQDVQIDQVAQQLSISLEYSVCYSELADYPANARGREFKVMITLDGSNGKFYLTREGWQQEEAEITVQASLQDGKIYGIGSGRFRYPDNFEKFTVNLDNVPWSGKLTIRVRNPYRLTFNTEKPFDLPNRNMIYLRNIVVQHNVEQNHNVDLLMNPAASKDDEILKVSFVDAPFYENAQVTFLNVLKFGSGYTGKWTCEGLKGEDTFGYVTLQSRAGQTGVAKMTLQGTIRAVMADVYRDKYSGKKMYLREYAWDLLEEEMSIVLCEVRGLLNVTDLVRRGPRVANVGGQKVLRSSGTSSHRVYNVAGSVQTTPKMIRDLCKESKLTEEHYVEVDDGLGGDTKKATLADLLRPAWKKSDLQYDRGYLLVGGKKTLSGDSDLWGGRRFEDWFNQSLRTQDSVRFLKLAVQEAVVRQLTSSDFVAGLLGSGFGLFQDREGHSYLEIDTLTARVKAVFAQLEKRELTYAGGNFIFSPAGMKCLRVEERADSWRCYLTVSDGEQTVENRFAADDLVQMRTGNLQSGSGNRYFWRRCLAVGADYIDLSKSDRDPASNDAPQSGDVLAVVGNKKDPARQNAIVLSVFGAGSPSLIQYAGINDYTLSGKARTILSPELNQFTGKFVFSASGRDVEQAVGEAQQKADSAKSLADAAQGAADKAQGAADAAQGTADKAKADAATAQGTADKAKQDAATAQSAADKANAGIVVLEEKNTKFQADLDGVTSEVSAVRKEVSSQGTQISSLGTRLTQTAESFTLEVARVEQKADSASTAVEEVDAKVEGIEPGSRNIIRDRQSVITESADYPEYSEVSSVINAKGELEVHVEIVKASENRGGRYVFLQGRYTVPIEPGIYTFSFDYRTNCEGGLAYIDFRLSDHSQRLNGSVPLENTGGEWRRGHFAADWREKTPEHKMSLFVIRPGSAKVGNWAEYRNVKLVRGDRGWDDSAAPEDVEKDYTGKAGQAQKSAEQAQAAAGKAQSAADKAKADAATAQGTADKAKQDAATAQGTADQAKQNAATAQNSANQALAGIGLDGAKMLYKDPTFLTGYNSLKMYNNAPSTGTVRFSRVDRPADAPTSSTHVVEVVSFGKTTPAYGGIFWGTASRPEAVFVTKIVAKIPVGYTLQFATNATGNYSERRTAWLTSHRGTGRYETYLFKIRCGASGAFSTTNFFYLTGGDGGTFTEEAPLKWHIAYATVFDATEDGYGDLTEIVRSELRSEVEVLEGKIALKVSQTDYDQHNQAVGSQLSSLTTQYNSLSGTVTRVDERVGKLEQAGFLTQAEGNTLFARKSLESGKEIISVINQTAEEVSIKASRINLNGAVTANGNVRITADGKIIAKSAEIQGSITSTSGKIGDFQIGKNWLTGSNLSMSGSLLHYVVPNEGELYLGSSPDMTVGGAAKLATFFLTYSDSRYAGLSAMNKVAVICCAPSDERSAKFEFQRSYAIWATGCSSFGGLRTRYTVPSGSGDVEIVRDVSMVVTTRDTYLWAHGIADGHIVWVVNDTDREISVDGDVWKSGNKIWRIHPRANKMFVYYNSKFFGGSDFQ